MRVVPMLLQKARVFETRSEGMVRRSARSWTGSEGGRAAHGGCEFCKSFGIGDSDGGTVAVEGNGKASSIAIGNFVVGGI